MSNGGDRPRPDPWAVVEHHAQAAAARGPDADLGDGQRLAMYAAAAPGVIDARPLPASEFGLLDLARRRGEWWTAPASSGRRIAWNASGEVICLDRSQTNRRVAAVTAFVTALATVAFARLAGPRSLIPGLILGVGAGLIARGLLPAWRPLGDRGNDRAAREAVAAWVGRYEAGVLSPES